MMDKIIKTSLVATALCFTASVNAANVTNIWSVSDTAVINCPSSPHGLWTNTLELGGGGGSCNEYYSIDAGSLLTEFDDGTAKLVATATNPAGVQASIDISFGGWMDNYSPVKNGGGGDPNDWDFYTTIDANSKITIQGTDYFVGIHDAPGSDFVFQIGPGANDKTLAYGGSVWLDVFEATGAPLYNGASHWDINMELTAVPLPAAVWLFGAGLVGLVSVARRKPA